MASDLTIDEVLAGPGSGARILVVDDVSDNRTMLSRRLHRLGYHNVSLAADGQEALELDAAEPFDAILLDIMMPRVNGIQVLEALAAAGRLEDTPVIMISAVTEVDAMVQCLELGAEDYLPKPFNLRLLRARLGSVLGKQALRRALRRQHARMEAELAEARAQQLGMVPSAFPRALGPVRATVHARMHPAREVGGDLYDVFSVGADTGDGALCVAIGDVSDKGMSAALFMARTRSLLRAVTLQLHGVYGVVPRPSQVLAVVNEELCKDNPSCMFVTLVLGLLDLRSGALFYGNAGHLPPLLLRPGAAATPLATQPALALGVMEGVSWPDWQLPMAAGDALVLVTDGLGDALDPAGQEYTAARVLADAQVATGLAPDAVTARLVEHAFAFAAGTPQADDVTVLALRLDP